MRSAFGKSTSHLAWKIRTVALIIGVVLVFGSTSVFARGGGHSGGGHGGGHSGGHIAHSGHHGGHHGDHVGDKPGGTTEGSIGQRHFANQNLCVPTDKIWADCLQPGEKSGS
jgi:hypothetical protein